ncbi:MAG: 2-succinyl-5-enolpyruvyl-6-hydroxy-3-cyclohexene-1-carboxylic-acid synthase [Phototrophicales bacterium]|nr:MAG: 2-succinyl-5-enolpyruvyl-6-hydroxy-3-cyclohexene-1-carboxylic-acid synthase [Phototrophicales bacterium]
MNRNTLYAQTLVDELARCGLTAVCAAPGSRHTPLMLAFAQHQAIRVYSHLDERSAAFFALGLALVSDQPVALVCTSGTAAANYFPAIIEAHQSRVPLIILTADRPHELRHSGANQTIDQIKLYGDYTLWFVDAPLPEATPSPIATRNLRTLANRAYAIANGQRKGVVHINLPFRKPLEPTPVDGDVTITSAPPRPDHTPYTTIHSATLPADIPPDVRHIIQDHDRILVVGGLRNKATLTDMPMLADAASGLRFGNPSAIGGYETFLQHGQFPPVDVVVRLGDVPVSKWLNAYLNDGQYQYYIHCGDTWSDDAHRVTHWVQASADALLALLPHHDLPEIRQMEKTTWQVITEEIENGAYFDGAAVYDVIDMIPEASTLFIGNSLPIRHVDQFGKPSNKHIITVANRGASGIDGNLSTALGAGAARLEHPLVAIVGDITFYHDMNGLLAVHRCGVPVTIVLLNNNGGGIFRRLPIRHFEPEFTEHFITPHDLDFSYAARLYNLEYTRIDVHQPNARAEFQQVFCRAVGATSMIIELCSDSLLDLKRRDEIVQRVKESIV